MTWPGAPRPGDISGNLLGPDDPLLTAIERMDAVRRKLLVVVDAERRLLGTLTDGDIRRGLMRRLSMDALVREVMNLDPVALKFGGSEPEAMRRLSERGMVLAPILDAEDRVIGLYPDAMGISAMRDTLVVIMAGGRGARLAPLTRNCPKPMLKVAGRPLLETIIERLRDQGFWRIRLAVNYLAERIEDHFGDGSAFGVEIRYLKEDHPRGTAGALALLDPTLDGPLDEPILVMNGDLLTRMNFADLIDFHKDMGAKASLCVRQHAFQAPHGVAETDGNRLVALREKPTFRWMANAGVYCLAPSVLDRVPAEGLYDMPELLAALVAEGCPVGAYSIHEYWLDIGHPPDFESAQVDFGAVFSI